MAYGDRSQRQNLNIPHVTQAFSTAVFRAVLAKINEANQHQRSCRLDIKNLFFTHGHGFISSEQKQVIMQFFTTAFDRCTFTWEASLSQDSAILVISHRYDLPPLAPPQPLALAPPQPLALASPQPLAPAQPLAPSGGERPSHHIAPTGRPRTDYSIYRVVSKGVNDVWAMCGQKTRDPKEPVTVVINNLEIDGLTGRQIEKLLEDCKIRWNRLNFEAIKRGSSQLLHIILEGRVCYFCKRFEPVFTEPVSTTKHESVTRYWVLDTGLAKEDLMWPKKHLGGTCSHVLCNTCFFREIINSHDHVKRGSDGRTETMCACGVRYSGAYPF